MNGIADGKRKRGIGREHQPRKRNQNHSNNLSQRIMVTESTLEEGSSCLNHSTLMGNSIFQKKGVRFIKKSGHCNVSHANLSDKRQRFIADIFTTGVDLQWRWNLFVFSAAFVMSWLAFGFIFWLLSYVNGDFEEHHSTENSSLKRCIKNLDIDHPFTSSFLFSLETQTTIGYGLRVVTEHCPVTIIMVVLQSVFGCILDAFMIGLIMAKISRPKKRAETLLFSRNAIINMRDGRLCLMFRVGNLRKSHLVEATIRMQYIFSRETPEGEFIPLEQVDLKLDLKNDSDRLFLVTPQTICHPIDESSPLWEISPEDLNTADFEIIVILEGMVEATGMTTQARASYLPSEVLWGHRFQNMISLDRNNAYKVNYKKFHNTSLTPDGPKQSAKNMHEEAIIRSTVESAVTLRGKKQLRASTSSTSSTRSSIRSGHLNPSSASDGRDSGYTAVEYLPTTFDNNWESADKPLTSTTSLSEASDGSEQVSEKNAVETKKELLAPQGNNNSIFKSESNLDEVNLVPSSVVMMDSLLVDVGEPVNGEVDETPVTILKQPIPIPLSQKKESEDVELLILHGNDNNADSPSPIVNQAEFSEDEMDKAFCIISADTQKATVCV